MNVLDFIVEKVGVLPAALALATTSLVKFGQSVKKINVDESILNGSFSQKEAIFASNYFSKTEASFVNNSAALEEYRLNLAACSNEFMNLYRQAEIAGIKLKFVEETAANGARVWKLAPETLTQIEAINLKYKQGSVAAKLYAEAQKQEALAGQEAAATSAKKTALMQAENAAREAGTRLSLKEQVQTEASIVRGNAHNAMLSAKAGLYKVAAAAANAFGVASLKQLGTMAAVTIGISLLIKGLQKLWSFIPTQNHLLEKAEESAQALEDDRNELESIEDELASIQERMEELQSMGALSLTEQEELRNLQEQNAELEKKYALLQKTAELEARDASEAAIEALHTYDIEYPGGSTYYGGFTATYSVGQQLDELVEKYRSIKTEMADLDLSDPKAKEEWEILNSQLQETEKEITELDNNAQTLLDDIDISTLDEASAQYANDTENAVARSLEAIGAITASESLQMQLPTEQYDILQQKLQEVADSCEIVTEDTLVEYLGEDLYNSAIEAAGGFDNLKDHILSLRGTEGIIDVILNGSTQKLDEFSKRYQEALKDNQIDLYNRPTVSGKDLIEKGWTNVPEDSTATVFTATGSAESGDDKHAIVVTPILPDGTVLSEEELHNYMDKILAGEEVDVDIKIADFFGADSVERANEFCDALHEAHADFYLGSEDILPEDVAADVRDKIESIINDDTFDISETSLKEILPEEFFDALEKGGGTVDALVEKLKELQNVDIGITDAIDELATLEETFKEVGTAYNEFTEDGVTSASTLKSLSDTFKNAIGDTDAFSNAIKVLGDSTSTTEDAQKAVEELINAYMNSADVLSNITDKTKDLYVAQLKKIGVTNADEVATYALAKATLTNTDADEEAITKALDLIGVTDKASASIARKAYCSLTAAQQEEIMKAVEESIAGSNFATVMANHSDALYALGDAAGYAAAAAYSAMAALSQISAEDMTNGQALEAMRTSQQISTFEIKMPNYLSAINSMLNYSPNISASSLPGASSSSNSNGSSGSSGSGTSASDTRKNKYDEEKAKLDHQLEMEYISYQTYYKKLTALGKKYLKGKKGNLEDYREHLETLADVRKSAYDSYKKDLDTALEKGTLSYTQYYKKVVALGKKWLKNQSGNKEDYVEYLDELADIRRDAFEEARDELDKQLEKGTIGYSTYFDKVSQLETKWLDGRQRTQEDYYEAVEEKFEKMAEWFEDEFDRVLEQSEIKTFYSTWAPGENDITAINNYIEMLNKAQLEGKLLWSDWYNLRYEANQKLVEAQKELYESQKDSVDELIDLVSDMLKQEKEDMIDALEDQIDAYSDIVDAKKEALDLTRAQLDYEREINELNRDLSELQAQAAVLSLDTSREGQAKYKALLEEIREKQEEIAEKQDDHAYDATIDALDESLEEYEEKLEEKIEDIEELMNHQGQWLKYVYSYIDSTDPSSLLSQLTAYNDQYGTGIAADVNELWSNYEQVRNQYLGAKIEDVIAAIREAANNASVSTEVDLNGDGIADSSENYSTIGKLIYQLKQNVEAMKKAKEAGDSKTYEALATANQNITARISDISNGTYDNLKPVDDYTWTTNNGTNLFDMISYNEDLGTAGMTAVSIINKMKNATTKELRNQYAAELRKIAGYENVFYDYATGHWYKNATAYKNQVALFDDDGETNATVGFALDSAKSVISAIKAAQGKSANTLRGLVSTLNKFSGYENAWYDPYTKHVYKSALGFSTGTAIGYNTLSGKPTASTYIGAMKNSGSATINNALAVYLRKIKGYENVHYDKTKKRWYKTKGTTTPLYHTGLQAGFVSDGSYLPTPKQNELYALLQKGELVLNKTDQDKLMVQMQVLSSLQDSIKKMTESASSPTTVDGGTIVVNLDQPIIINGNADKSTVELLKKQGKEITNQTLTALQDTLKLRGYNGRVQSNRQ